MDYRTLQELALDGIRVAESNVELVKVGRALKSAHQAVSNAIGAESTQAAYLARRRAEDEIVRLRQLIQRIDSEHRLMRDGSRTQ